MTFSRQKVLAVLKLGLYLACLVLAQTVVGVAFALVGWNLYIGMLLGGGAFACAATAFYGLRNRKRAEN